MKQIPAHALRCIQNSSVWQSTHTTVRSATKVMGTPSAIARSRHPSGANSDPSATADVLAPATPVPPCYMGDGLCEKELCIVCINGKRVPFSEDLCTVGIAGNGTTATTYALAWMQPGRGHAPQIPSVTNVYRTLAGKTKTIYFLNFSHRIINVWRTLPNVYLGWVIIIVPCILLAKFLTQNSLLTNMGETFRRWPIQSPLECLENTWAMNFA